MGWTAFYTAAVWQRLGVPGAARFVTGRGRLLAAVVGRGGWFLGLGGQYRITNLFLAARHLGLDHLLEESRPAQVIELAAGLSSRGAETTRWRSCHYIEVDQPALIGWKQKRLAADSRPLAAGALHLLIEADLLKTGGRELAHRLQPYLNPTQPVVIVAEGLTGYLGEPALRQLLATLHELAVELGEVTLLVDFYLRLNRTAHGRVAIAMWPAQALWRMLGAPMRMFLRDENASAGLAGRERL